MVQGLEDCEIDLAAMGTLPQEQRAVLDFSLQFRIIPDIYRLENVNIFRIAAGCAFCWSLRIFSFNY